MDTKWTPDRRVGWSFEGPLIVPKMMSPLYWTRFLPSDRNRCNAGVQAAGTEGLRQRSMIVHCALADSDERPQRPALS